MNVPALFSNPDLPVAPTTWPSSAPSGFYSSRKFPLCFCRFLYLCLRLILPMDCFCVNIIMTAAPGLSSAAIVGIVLGSLFALAVAAYLIHSQLCKVASKKSIDSSSTESKYQLM
jgi:hypothetical protein